jgi:hypothetical protein
MANNGMFQKRTLNVQRFGDVTLLDAIAMPDGARLFFTANTPMDKFRAGIDTEIVDMRSVGDAPILTCTLTGDVTVSVSVGEADIEVVPSAAETDLFEGLNTGFAIRNGETLETTLEWLKYHVEHHGMNAALILDRARPGSDKPYANKLKNKAAKIKGLKRLVLLDSPVPLGKSDLPPEAHPYNVPGAPGKDRMEIPPADPWTSPLGELQLFELARLRFLNTARAVMTIEMYDLLVKRKGSNVFDRATKASHGCIQLDGHQIYPWRVRPNQPARFGDHICRQFDAKGTRKRWCVAPAVAKENTVWRLIRVVGAPPAPDETAPYLRCMALRHPTETVSKIVPKTSLIEDKHLLDLAQNIFNYKPVRTPEENAEKRKKGETRTCIVTTMKNEGPFILEWLAYHRVIGVQDFLVYTNDCTDGTDTMLQMLQGKGLVQHRENPFRESGLKPQHAALQAADNEPMVNNADWLICMDVDEFIDIKCGDGTLNALYGAIGDANMISLTWRLFGNNNVHAFKDGLIIEQYTRCAEEFIRKPHQAWGFKTLYHNVGIFKKMGVHRPKGLKPQLWEDINWVNGSGRPMPSEMYRNGWRSTVTTYGYDLVQLNHYAVRSAESFLVKRDRGRVNHVDRDQGLVYWFRMNNNAIEERSIQRMIPAVRAEMDRLLADPDIAAAHAYSVEKHSAKIKELKAGDSYAAFYKELTDPKLEKLSQMHSRFGRNVFLQGPSVIPDEIADKDPDEDFFFTVEDGETAH